MTRHIGRAIAVLGAASYVTAIVCLGGCAGPGAMTTAGETGDEGEFAPLFDGDTLDGFVQVLDSPWEAHDGIISSKQNPAGRRDGESWLLTKRSYEDFVLRLEFRITPGGNSGVFIRDPVPWQERLAAPLGGKPPWEAGYEVNINNDEPNYPTGSIWDAAKGQPRLQRESEWNDLVIRVEGDQIWTWVNGRPAIEGAQLPPRSERGAIGFQRHGTPAYRDKLIEFRNIEIRELP